MAVSASGRRKRVGMPMSDGLRHTFNNAAARRKSLGYNNRIWMLLAGANRPRLRKGIKRRIEMSDGKYKIFLREWGRRRGGAAKQDTIFVTGVQARTG